MGCRCGLRWLMGVDTDRDAADAVMRAGTGWGIDALPLLPQREDEGRGEEGQKSPTCPNAYLSVALSGLCVSLAFFSVG